MDGSNITQPHTLKISLILIGVRYGSVSCLEVVAMVNTVLVFPSFIELIFSLSCLKKTFSYALRNKIPM